MPDNIKQFIESVPAGVLGSSIMAVLLSALRILGDANSKKWQRLAIEVPASGCIATAVALSLAEFGVGHGTATLVGAMIGHLGTDYVRDVARRFVSKRWIDDV
jgi:lambda family phage holin